MTLTAKKERLQLLNVQLSVPFPVVTSSNGPGSQAHYIRPTNGEGRWEASLCAPLVGGPGVGRGGSDPFPWLQPPVAEPLLWQRQAPPLTLCSHFFPPSSVQQRFPEHQQEPPVQEQLWDRELALHFLRGTWVRRPPASWGRDWGGSIAVQCQCSDLVSGSQSLVAEAQKPGFCLRSCSFSVLRVAEPASER